MRDLKILFIAVTTVISILFMSCGSDDGGKNGSGGGDGSTTSDKPAAFEGSIEGEEAPGDVSNETDKPEKTNSFLKN